MINISVIPAADPELTGIAGIRRFGVDVANQRLEVPAAFGDSDFPTVSAAAPAVDVPTSMMDITAIKFMNADIAESIKMQFMC